MNILKLHKYLLKEILNYKINTDFSITDNPLFTIVCDAVDMYHFIPYKHFIMELRYVYN